MSKYEAMRRDPSNWKLGAVYYCPDDPRIVVRNLAPFGWAWNFGHKKVYFGILLAIAVFMTPACVAWLVGVRSLLVIGIILLLALVAVVYVASRLARPPLKD